MSLPLLILGIVSLLVSNAASHFLPRSPPLSSVTQFSSSAADGDSFVQFESGSTGLDAPKISFVNHSVFDWWYFDIVSEDRKSSVVFTFFTSTAAAFPFLEDPNNVLQVNVWASFPNGTVTSLVTHAEHAVVESRKDGSAGNYEPTGMNWSGEPDMSSYLITVDDPNLDIKGTFSLKSTAPAHYPCGPVKPKQNLEILPHVGWANAVPDAIGTVDMTIMGSRLRFEGVAYHDKNWGDQPFFNSVGSWYWGHTRLGPYSVVWFDALTPSGTEYVSSYVSKDGKILAAKCSGVKARPAGNDGSTYPPTPGDLPTKFRVEFDLEEGPLIVDITPTLMLVNAETLYARWIGEAVANVQGKKQVSGPVLYEQFVIP